MMRLFTSSLVVAAMCLALAAPAHAGNGGGGSKGNVTVKVKNIGGTSMQAAAVSGSTFSPPKAAAYKTLTSPNGTANFSVRKGTFSLFGRQVGGTDPDFTQALPTSSGNTTYVIASLDDGTATVVSKSDWNSQ